jgi:hypothetical protein
MLSKALQIASANAGGENLYIEDVFSTYLYTGNGSTQTITNGIDLAGEGGMIWTKKRSTTGDHNICYTDAGTGTRIIPNETLRLLTGEIAVQSFNSDGVTFGSDSSFTASGQTFASWTFRKAEKFFDVVTYTGNGVAGRTVAHNLGSVPACMIVKVTSANGGWLVYHRSLGATKNLVLNETNAEATSALHWNNTAPTSSVFTVGTIDTNETGRTYVAYLFAHDAGGFGDDGEQNVVSCGSYTADASNNFPVNLGFEPQWVMIKRTDSTGDWEMLDTMRGFKSKAGDGQFLEANKSFAEFNDFGAYLTSTGFIGSNQSASNGGSYIYIAIRRPMKVPESGTEVFSVDQGDSETTNPQFRSNFVTDFAFFRSITAGNNWETTSRLQGRNYMRTNLTTSEAGDADIKWDFMNGFYGPVRNSNFYAWMFRRASGFFDVVCYTGNGSATRSITHNLGVSPELAIFKSRNVSGNFWLVFQKDVCTSPNKVLFLNNTDALAETGNLFSSTGGFAAASTATTLNNIGSSGSINGSGNTQVAYLFATCPNVSKVGSYTGNGSSQTINCGFTSGARFVLIKRTDSTGDWMVSDSARGIVSGNDPYLELNNTNAEVTGEDWLDTDNTGFIVNEVSSSNANTNGATYIFLAIA